MGAGDDALPGELPVPYSCPGLRLESEIGFAFEHVCLTCFPLQALQSVLFTVAVPGFWMPTVDIKPMAVESYEELNEVDGLVVL
mmetsp:Transcript_28076/g.91048  ORF Transcript_28076/g.91048 Transcript_28076/m.91048 type:complete len:84 (-) Transcript_28076:1018-1269(-)